MLKYEKEITYTSRKVQPQEIAGNYINSSPNYLGKISLTNYLLLHPIKNWQKNLQITFLKNIVNIRKLFDGIPNYKPNPINIPQLNKFPTLSESQLYKIIMEMSSRTCELDIIPTVVNLLLSFGHFFDD